MRTEKSHSCDSTRNRFLRSLTTLLSGSVVSQLIVLISYPIVTRLFCPADFAIFNIFYSYIEVLIILSTCKYEVALPVATDSREAHVIYHTALRYNTIFCLILLTLIALLLLFDAMPGETRSLGVIALMIPPMVFFCGTTRVYTFLFNRHKQYGPIATSDIVNAASGSGLKIGMGLLAPFATLFAKIGLPLATLLGQAAANINYIVRLKKERKRLGREGSGAVEKICSAEKKAIIRRYRNYPRFVMPKDFLNSISYNLPFIWLAIYFEKPEVGLFALALTFTFKPVNIINNAMERIFYPDVAERVAQKQSIGALLYRFFVRLNLLALPLFVIGFIFAEPLFGFCFGGRWAGCGRYVQVLLPWTFVSLTSTSLSFVCNVFGTQRKEFRFYLMLLTLRVGAVVLGIVQGSFFLGIALFAAAGAIVSVALLLWYILQIRRYETNIRA